VSRIVSLVIENVKRLSAVEIQPDGAPVVVIAGANGAGKSSVIDAIEMAIGGEKRIPKEPVRRGSDTARVVVDLGDLVVTRRFTKAGTSLMVTNRDGKKYGSPQAILDGLVGRLSFDPMAFALAEPDEQETTIRMLAGIDTSDMEVRRKTLYDQRTLVNRDVTQAQGALAKLPPAHEDVGTDPESYDGLAAQLGHADELARVAASADRAATVAESAIREAESQAKRIASEIEDLHARLAAADVAYEQAQMAVTVKRDTYDAARHAAEAATVAVPERTAIHAKIGAIQARNQKVTENQRRAQLVLALSERQRASQDLSDQMTAIDHAKAEQLARAAFPLAGLGLNEHGVTWDSLPFSQASTAIKTRVSVAIGAALNPKLRVLLVRGGNDLDEQSLSLLSDLAQENGLQVWLERIQSADGMSTVVIEDGAVQAPQMAGAW